MSKATEDDLATLHGAVARSLTEAVQCGSVEVAGEKMVVPPSAAHIMAAITFLKNNNITADATSNAELSDLAAELSRTRQASKGRMSKQTLSDVAEQLDRDLGGLMQ
jgi:hypothetical protein